MLKFLAFLLFLFSQSCFSKINVDKSSSILQVESGANFVAQGSITDFQGHLVKDSGASISGGSISFLNGVFEDNGNKIKLTGDLDATSLEEIILDGSKTFKGKRGNVLQKLKIRGSNNRLEGIVQLKENLEIQDSNTSFTCAIQGRLPCNILLNGGTIYLEEDLHFVDDMFFTTSGLVLLNGRNLHLGSREITCNAPLYFDQAQDIELHANLHLAETWTFSQDSVLEGNYRILYLEDGGEIVIESGSSLLLRNISIQKISGNKIKCLDRNATVSFQNVTWVQDENYSFTIGAIEIIDSLNLKGTSTFAYQSAQTSTIWAHGKLVVDRGMTFSYDPIWNATVSDWEDARNFLCFEDSTSAFELKGSTLHVTTTSLKFKKGNFRVKDKSYIYSELEGNFKIEEGFIIGNNNLADDVKCEISGGATLEISNGAFSYKNESSSSWAMLNNQSKLYVASGARLKLHQSLSFGDGVVCFEDGSRLARATGKTLDGNVCMLGLIYYECCYD